MSVLHFILDLAALLFWVNWRSMGFKEYVPYRSTFVHTLKSAEPRRPGRWRYLAGLLALLVIRAWLYQLVGAALRWVPVLDLQVLTLPFRSDQPWRMMQFSFLSFVLILAVFHVWLILLSVVNRALPDTVPAQHLVRLHLGRASRWPVPVQLLLPVLGAPLVWLPVQTFLTWVGLTPSGATLQLLAGQGALVGLSLFLSWKYLIAGLLLVHLINSYVYLGRSSFLDFASLTARQLLRPLSWLPLRLGRVDFAPAAGAVTVWVAAQWAERGLTLVFTRLSF